MADLYGPGRTHARSLIDSGNINDGAWSFSAEDGNALLGDPPDWTAYASWHLGRDAGAERETKDAWKYPFGKDGALYPAALRAAASRAAQQGDQAINEAASALLDAIPEPDGAQAVRFGPLTREAAIRPESVNATARTFDVIWTTGAAVKRQDWLTGATYEESLSVAPTAVRLDRLNNGAPFLDSHHGFGVRNVLGTIVPGTAQVAEGRGVGTIRLSRRADVTDVWRDIQDGILRNISVGYDVHRYERTEDAQGRLIAIRAVDWEPFELSAVPMGADDGAKIRAADPATAKSIPVTLTRAAAPTKETRSMEPTGSVMPVTEPVEPSVPNERDLGAAQERERVNGIIDGANAIRRRVDDPVIKKLIDQGTSLVEARGIILDLARGDAQDSRGPRSAATVRVLSDPLESVWAGISGALLHRVNPSFTLDDNARQYRMHSLLRAAEECLEQRGIRTRGLSKMDIAGMALGLQVRAGLHTTSDFANILADVANKTLRRAYEEAPQTFLPIARRIPMPDFKAVKRNQLGEAPALAKVLEHGEFQRGTIAEGKESFALATYGRIFGITRKALVNDDLDAFGRLTAMFGRSARNLESDLVWYEILNNGTMGDGIALFDSSTHKNYTSSGTAIDVSSLGVGRAAMRNQKALDGRTYVNVEARYLIVPPGKETLADQYTTQITPALGSSVNPFAGRLTVISEPRLEGGVTIDTEAGTTTAAGSATAWYLAASTDQIDIVEWGFLDGQDGPVMDTRVGFDVDGLEVKCRHDVAAKVIDYRGLYKNAGA